MRESDRMCPVDYSSRYMPSWRDQICGSLRPACNTRAMAGRAGFVEYVGMMLGPLIGGFLLAASGPALVFAVCGAATANSAVTSLRLKLVGRTEIAGNKRVSEGAR